MPGVAVVRYPVPDGQHQEGCFWKCLLLGMLWPGCLAQHCAVVAITPMRLFRVVFGMSKADGSITAARQGKTVAQGWAVGFLLAVPCCHPTAAPDISGMG